MSIKSAALTTLGLIDLTSLNEQDTQETILELCQKSQSEFGLVPAICIYPQFIPVAKKYFSQHSLAVKIASVSNFPDGGDDLESALAETRHALELGADEVDIVFPYRALIAGNQQIGAAMIKSAKQICGAKTLKVIIESGVLADPELIRLASKIAIQNGADFIKTSTGKVSVNATIAATKVMLQTIKDSGADCGFKAAGGIRLVSEAQEYLEQARLIMGEDWINPKHLRFGASSLLADVLNVLHNQASVINQTTY